MMNVAADDFFTFQVRMQQKITGSTSIVFNATEARSNTGTGYLPAMSSERGSEREPVQRQQ